MDPQLRDVVERLAGKISDGQPGSMLQFRQAVVTALATTPARVSITLAGSATVIPNIRYLASYTAAVNDTVWLLQNGPDLIVMGKLAA